LAASACGGEKLREKRKRLELPGACTRPASIPFSIGLYCYGPLEPVFAQEDHPQATKGTIDFVPADVKKKKQKK
jgi:hypothetical protein